MDATTSLGERIKMVRERAELSQKEFGKKVELSQTAVTALENNQNEPRLSTFNNIVEAFKVNPEWLRTGLGEIRATVGMLHAVGNDSERIEQLERELEREKAWTEKLYEENKQFRALGKTLASSDAADETPVIPLWKHEVAA